MAASAIEGRIADPGKYRGRFFPADLIKIVKQGGILPLLRTENQAIA